MLGIPALAQPSLSVSAKKSQENEDNISTSIYISIYLSISITLPDEIPVSS